MSNNNEYGTYLKEKREQQGITLEQVYKDTKINVKVLKALENMGKDMFPSETYRIGTLRVYARYLSIDEEEIMKMVKINQIQEKPVEFEFINIEAKAKKQKKYALFILLGFVLILGISMLFVFGVHIKIINSIRSMIIANAENSVTIKRIERFNESNYNLNETIILVSNELELPIKITSIKPPKILFKNVERELPINTPYTLDFDDNNSAEFLLLVRSIDLNRNSLLLRLDPKVSDVNLSTISQKESNTESSIVSDGESINITTSAMESAIQISLSFKETSYFKLTNDKTVIKEGTKEKNSTETQVSNDAMTVYLSNDRHVDIIVNGQSVNFESKGLPLVFILKWNKELSGRYVLQAIPLP